MTHAHGNHDANKSKKVDVPLVIGGDDVACTKFLGDFLNTELSCLKNTHKNELFIAHSSLHLVSMRTKVVFLLRCSEIRRHGRRNARKNDLFLLAAPAAAALAFRLRVVAAIATRIVLARARLDVVAHRDADVGTTKVWG